MFHCCTQSKLCMGLSEVLDVDVVNFVIVEIACAIGVIVNLHGTRVLTY